MTPNPTHADECEQILQAMIDAGKPVSIDDLHAKLKIPRYRIGDALLALRFKGQVGYEATRVRGQGKTNLFNLKAKV